jgi:hypothetical protein
MVYTYHYFQTATDVEGWITPVGESVAESIDNNIVTYWNPQGATGNHSFKWLGDLSGTTMISGVMTAFRMGAEPDRIKVFTDQPSLGGVLLQNFNNPTYDTTTIPGYAVLDASGWAPLLLNKMYLELQQQHGGPFNFNEVTAYFNPPPPSATKPNLLKRSPHGRESFKFPGRKKPRWMSYQQTPVANTDVV